MIIKKAITNNTVYIVQDPYTFSKSFKVTLWIISILSMFSLHFSTNSSTIFFLHLQFNLNTLLRHVTWLITFTFIVTRIPNKSFITYSFLVLFIHIYIFHCYKHLHLVYIYTCKFHTILRVLQHLCTLSPKESIIFVKFLLSVVMAF